MKEVRKKTMNANIPVILIRRILFQIIHKGFKKYFRWHPCSFKKFQLSSVSDPEIPIQKARFVNT